MRIKIHLEGSGILPFDYHYHLGAAMLKFKKIADEELSTRLHYSRDIKMYTFSEIVVPKRKKMEKGIKILDGYAYIIYTSPHMEYVEALATGLLSDPALRVGELTFEITRVEVMEEPEVNWREVHFKTLSPISMYSSSNGKNKDIPLFPTQKEWYINLEKNVKKSYEKFYGTRIKGNLMVDTLHSKPKRYFLKDKKNGNPVQAVHGHFIFRGNPHLIKMAYDAGVGEHGAFGFGCLEVVQDNKYYKNNTSQIRLNR